MKEINKSILSIALPSIVANITTPLLGLVDLAIVGHLGSASYIAAIAVGGTIFSMIYWVFALLRMGTSGITAQAYGAGDIKERDNCFYRAMGVAIVFGTLLIALQGVIGPLMMGFMDSDPVSTELAETYFFILIYGAPATLGLYVLNGWFIGLQNSKLTMWLSIVINITNIGASIGFVYGLGMGISGVAAGTLLAQWCGFLAGCIMVSRYHPRLGRLQELLDGKALQRFFKLNSDIFLRTLCLVAVTVWFTRAGAQQGEIILSVNALLMQYFILFSYAMDGFAFAGEALAGRFTGSGEPRRKREMIVALFKIGVWVSLLFTCVYALLGDVVMGILSDDAEVITAAKDFKWWAVTIPFAGMTAFIWDGIYIGETRTRQMLISMGLAMIAFFAIWFTLSGIWGNHALWLAFVSYLLIRGIVLTLFR